MPVQAIDVRRHRQKIASALEEELVLDDGSAYSTAVVYLSGDRHHERHGTDVELPFRQESNFYYATGVEMEAGYALLYHPASGYAALIVPFVSLEDAVWIGAAPPRDIVRTRYDVDGVFFDDEEGSRAVVACLKAAMYREKIYAVHTMAGATIPETLSKALNSAHTETKHLAAALTAARLHKEPAELACMRIANRASSDAHAALMRAVSKLSAKGTAWNEQQATAVWYSEVISRGCMLQAYQPIVAYGPNAATLHYNRNDADVPAGGDSFLLVDAGGEYRCYAADITRTYPVGGKFSADQRALYEVVLRAQMTVLGAVRAGVEWEALHRRAVEVVGQGLVDMGVLKLNGATVQDLCWKLFVVQRFFPHGLGHLIGLDVHDVGGYPRGVERIQEPGTRYLRLRRTLEPGMVVTVEPGCYFIDALIADAIKDPAQAPHIDMVAVERFRKLGGVRIEDCVAVTADGCENLTTAPKTVDEIEKVMAGN